MTASIGARAIGDAALVSSTGSNGAGPTQALSALDSVQVSKADGLRGALGLYEVTIDGRTQFMTGDELESLPRVTSFAPNTAAAESPTSSVIKKGNDINGTIVKGFG